MVACLCILLFFSSILLLYSSASLISCANTALDFVMEFMRRSYQLIVVEGREGDEILSSRGEVSLDLR